MITIPMQIETDTVSIPMAAFSTDIPFAVDVASAIEVVQTNPYTGEYRFTPCDESITARTADKYLADDIVIDPIPSNYGHITWNGTVLTVS